MENEQEGNIIESLTLTPLQLQLIEKNRQIAIERRRAKLEDKRNKLLTDNPNPLPLNPNHSPIRKAHPSRTLAAPAPQSRSPPPGHFKMRTVNDLMNRKAVQAWAAQKNAKCSLETIEEVQGEVKVLKFVYKEAFKNIAEGLSRYDNIFTENELRQYEGNLLDLLEQGRQKELCGESYVFSKSREMLLFGYHYQYFSTTERKKGVWNGVTVEPFPPWISTVVDRLIQLKAIREDQRPDSAIINYYPKNGTIPPHIDASDFSRPIISLRLLSNTKLSFGGKFGKNKDGQSEGIKFKIDFPRGSVVLMQGHAGNKTTHSIEPQDVSTPTASITLRQVIQPHQT